MYSTIKKRIKVSWHDNDLMVLLRWPYKERSVMCLGSGTKKLTSCPRETDSDFEHILKMRVLHQYKNKNSDHLASLVWMSIPCLACMADEWCQPCCNLQSIFSIFVRLNTRTSKLFDFISSTGLASLTPCDICQPVDSKLSSLKVVVLVPPCILALP